VAKAPTPLSHQTSDYSGSPGPQPFRCPIWRPALRQSCAPPCRPGRFSFDSFDKNTGWPAPPVIFFGTSRAYETGMITPRTRLAAPTPYETWRLYRGLRGLPSDRAELRAQACRSRE